MRGSDSPRRLVYVAPFVGGGGAERVILSLLSRLDRELFQPEIVIFSRSGPVGASPPAAFSRDQLANLVPEYIPVHELGRPRLRGAILPLLRLLRRLEPDIVLAGVHNANLAVLALKPFLRGLPWIVIRESSIPSRSLPSLHFGTLMRLGYDLLYPKADTIICQWRGIAEELRRDFGLSDIQLKLLPNPVDTSRIRGSITHLERVPGRGLRFVAAGRFRPVKGFDRLLEMFAHMPEEDHLTILGDGPQAGSLIAQAEHLGIHDRVSFPGYVSNPWLYYAGADAFVVPSHWEGLPNAALEALVCGVPVIATPESGGLVELVRETPKGSVTLVPIGAPFIAAMRRAPASGVGLRASLLPQRFDIDNVVPEFTSMLANEDPQRNAGPPQFGGQTQCPG